MEDGKEFHHRERGGRGGRRRFNRRLRRWAQFFLKKCGLRKSKEEFLYRINRMNRMGKREDSRDDATSAEEEGRDFCRMNRMGRRGKGRWKMEEGVCRKWWTGFKTRHHGWCGGRAVFGG
jgi:hypothetical protein